jgi:lipopolysaccharide export system permease protein
MPKDSTLRPPRPLARLLRSRLLPGILAVIGIDCAFLYIFFLIKAPITADDVELFVNAAFYPQSEAELIFGFIEKCWIAVMLSLIPAFIVSLIRLRGPALLLPITITSVLVCSFWLYADLHYNLQSAVVSLNGETPSFNAYVAKLVFIGIAILSPPVFTFIYYRASIMDRYVVRVFGTPFLLTLTGIVSIMIIMDLGDNGGDFMDASANFGTVLRFYVIQIPFMLVSVVDASLLLSLLYALGRMSRSNEIISMLGTGRSMLRVLTPLILIGGYCALVSLAFNYEWAPRAERLKDEMLQTIDAKESAKKNKTDARNVGFMNKEEHRFWYMDRLPIDLSNANRIKNIEIHGEDAEGKPGSQWYAKSAWWEPTDSSWILNSGRYWETPVSAGVPFDRLVITGWNETPWLIQSDQIKPEFLGVRELLAYINTNSAFSERRLAKYRTTMHSRYAVPFRCIVVVLIAAPLGIVYSRRGLLGGVAYSIFIFAAIFFLTSTFTKAGEGGYLSPVTAAWLANGIFGVIGAVLLYYRARNKDVSHLNPLRWFRRSA